MSDRGRNTSQCCVEERQLEAKRAIAVLGDVQDRQSSPRFLAQLQTHRHVREGTGLALAQLRRQFLQGTHPLQFALDIVVHLVGLADIRDLFAT